MLFTTRVVGTQQVTLPIEKKGKQWKIVFKKVKEFNHRSQETPFKDKYFQKEGCPESQ